MLYRTGTPVFSLRREIDRLFDDAFGSSGGADGRTSAWLPAVDVQEDSREYRFDVELPGIAPEEVEITADNGVLTIRGEKSQRVAREGDEGRYHFVERSYGSFARSFQLPQGVQDDAISATFENGLLSVRVPKAERPQPRRIRIDAGEQRQVSSGGGARSTATAEKAERGRKEERKEEAPA